MKKLKDALLRLISQKPNPITIPPPSDPSTDRAVGTTMALLDEVILIYPSMQAPAQIDPHRQLMRFWNYDMPNGYWGAWDTQFYFTADFHWGNQLAVRLPRVRADDDPALHRPWNKKPNITVSRDLEEANALIAKLQARPELTLDRLTSAIYLSRGVDPKVASDHAAEILLHLDPVTLPPSSRATAERTLAGLFDDSRAELAELRARPVLTVEALDEALIMASAAYYDRSHDDSMAWPHKRYAEHVVKSLGPVTLPSPDRAEELTIAFFKEMDRGKSDFPRQSKAMRAALAKLSPAPAREVAPTLVAVSDEELMHEFYTGAENGTRPVNGIRAVRAKLGAAEVTADALTNGWIAATGFTAPEVLKDAAVVRAKMAHAIALAVRATAAKGG